MYLVEGTAREDLAGRISRRPATQAMVSVDRRAAAYLENRARLEPCSPGPAARPADQRDNTSRKRDPGCGQNRCPGASRWHQARKPEPPGKGWDSGRHDRDHYAAHSTPRRRTGTAQDWCRTGRGTGGEGCWQSGGRPLRRSARPTTASFRAGGKPRRGVPTRPTRRARGRSPPRSAGSGFAGSCEPAPRDGRSTDPGRGSRAPMPIRCRADRPPAAPDAG